MPASKQNNLGLWQGWSLGESGWGDEMNYNLLIIDTLAQAAAIEISNPPPSSQSKGDCYIVGQNPTGVFSGHSNNVAVYDGSGWIFLTPKKGWLFYDRDTESYYNFTGTGWTEQSGGGGGGVTYQNNLTATTDPTASDDSNAGYEPLSRWVNQSTEEFFLCIDASPGAAVWVKSSLTIDELGSAALLNTGTDPGQVPMSGALSPVSFTGQAVDVEYEPGTSVKTALDDALSGGGGGSTDVFTEGPLAPLGIDTKPVMTRKFGSFTDDYQWSGGVLGPDGMIYCAPTEVGGVLEIDPVTRATTVHSPRGTSYRWQGGVVAPNGKIYFMPRDSRYVLEFDPATKNTELLGYLSTANNKYRGGVLAPNGKIYGIPFGAGSFLEVDPIAGTVTNFGITASPYDGTTGDCGGGVLAPNGKIYCMPGGRPEVVVLDPGTQNISFFPDIFTNDGFFSAGVLAPNGMIYAIPASSRNFYKIDPVNETQTSIGPLLPIGEKYRGGVLAPNGKIYCIPFDSTQVAEIDPETDSVRFIGDFPGNGKWFGAVLASNGRIYGVPHRNSEILVVDGVGNGGDWWAINPYVNCY